MGQSPHQLIYNLYNIIALTEIKGYAMVQFSYMMLKLYNRGNFTLESELARRSFEGQATDKLWAVKNVLPKMSQDYWRCDAERQREGQTYVRITNLLQVRFSIKASIYFFLLGHHRERSGHEQHQDVQGKLRLV